MSDWLTVGLLVVCAAAWIRLIAEIKSGPPPSGPYDIFRG